MTTESIIDRGKLLRQELERFIQVVTQQMQPECIILFGSFVAGQMSAWSDLDLVVVMETELPFYERIKHVLHIVRPKVGMDILVYTPGEWAEMTSKRTFVKDEILAKGQMVYERAS